MRSNQADDKVIREFTRDNMRGSRYVLEVGIVEWQGPHTPVVQWRVYRTWDTPPDEEALRAAYDLLLLDPRYFMRCQRCRALTPTGCMHDDELCQGCAEQYLGVIH